MRRLIRRTVHTNNKPAAGEQGGVTLETALIMPVFLLFALFLLFLVQTSVIAMSLHGALSQTVRLAASSWYPVSLLDREQDAEGGNAETRLGKLQGSRETLREFGEWLPAPLNTWADSVADGSWLQEAAKLSFQQLALQLADAKVIKADRFRILSVEVPKSGSADQAFLSVVAEYRLPFRVPFGGRPLVIRSQARERAWIGGSPSRAGTDESGSGTLHVTFVSLEPNPVRPGRKATLLLRTAPGASLDLSVLYKSGFSEAKHLGTATADSTGLVSWSWHVSGNTASGEWRWEVRGEGGAVYTQPFQVKRKNE